MIKSYNILCETQHGIISHFVSTDIDLLDQYKIALLQGKGYIIWEDGVIDCSKIVGITRQPTIKAPKKD